MNRPTKEAVEAGSRFWWFQCLPNAEWEPVEVRESWRGGELWFIRNVKKQEPDCSCSHGLSYRLTMNPVACFPIEYWGGECKRYDPEPCFGPDDEIKHPEWLGEKNEE